MLWKAFLDILFPPLCHGCKAFIADAGELHLCRECRKGSPPVAFPCCTICGQPFLTELGIDHRCGSCISSVPPFDAARAAVIYGGPVKELIHRFKYGGKVLYRRPLAVLTAEILQPFITEREVDLIIPVPLHLKRLRQRGFNQAILLGEVLGKRWRLPLSRHNLRRIRWTEPQITLSARERKDNVSGAFAVYDPSAVAGKRVILLDDVYTTGSTVAECSRVLKDAGAAAVFVVTVARAVS